MSDLMTKLRAKLEAMQKVVDAKKRIPHHVRRSSYLDGCDYAVNEMDDFLDAWPDGKPEQDEEIHCEICMGTVSDVSALFIVGPEQISVCHECRMLEESWQTEQAEKAADEINDGWHDLRENPEDLPEEHGDVSLIVKDCLGQGRVELRSGIVFSHCTISYYKSRRWNVLAWRPHILLTIPACFQAQEKE